jgi:IclR family KDG regulon transcriptional repressor
MNQYGAPAVDLAARVLKLLTRYRMSEATLTMISTELEAPKASCLRVLRTLESHGLLRYNEDNKKYSLGPYAVVLGARAEENIDYLSALRPLLREAAERTGCTAVLIQQIDENRMTYLAKHEVTNRLRVNISIGNRFPITEVSYGKWLLAYAPAEVRDALLLNGLRQVTPYTVVDRDEYLAQLDEIRADGILVSREEYVLGVTAVSCPVFDVHDQFLGVLAVLGLIGADDGSTLDSVVTAMREISQQCYLSGANGKGTPWESSSPIAPRAGSDTSD